MPEVAAGANAWQEGRVLQLRAEQVQVHVKNLAGAVKPQSQSSQQAVKAE
jgi:hypothetical protein